MRSRTPNATSSSAKASSQRESFFVFLFYEIDTFIAGSRQGSPTRGPFVPQSASKIRTGISSAQPRRLPEAHRDLRPTTPPRVVRFYD